MNLDDIKRYLEENKSNADVKNFVEGLGTQKKVDITQIQQFLRDDTDGQRWLQSQLDSKVTQGIDTWKNNNLQKTIDDEISKRFPDETPESKRLKQLESELEQERNARKRESLKNKALGIASEKKLPTELVDYLLGEDEDKTVENMSTLETVFQTHIQSAIEQRFQESGYNPNKSKDTPTFTREQIEAMSPEEINKNWETIQTSLGSL